MPTTIKLQKIGNSIRATMPKEVVETLSLREGEKMVIDVMGEAVILKKKGRRGLAQFYGILKEKTGRVEYWSTPEEIKSIWE